METGRHRKGDTFLSSASVVPTFDSEKRFFNRLSAFWVGTRITGDVSKWLHHLGVQFQKRLVK